MKILTNISFNTKSITEDYQVDFLNSYKTIPVIFKPLRVISFKYDLKIQRLFELPYNPEVFKTYDVIILSDEITITKSKARRIIKDVEKYAKPNCKLIFFWVNIVHDLDYLELSDRWTVGTFDKNDALRYGLRYYSLFYIYDGVKPILSDYNNYVDVFFAGLDKGRFNHLKAIEAHLNVENIKTNFIYVDPFKAVIKRKYSKFVSYGEMLRHIFNSKSILDYYQDNQIGFTQRLYEAIFHQKKLITNNPYIKNLSFFNKNNILVIQNDDVSEVKDFLRRPFIPYNEFITNNYKLHMWLKRVINDEECQDIIL